ncbi:MAG TPA: helix-turn-helix transcriptional regulator [Candidatus Angelobacter sp.]|nr:helix-turn-helix transcriptional regulator [Candidatus Angelobacter sp.]
MSNDAPTDAESADLCKQFGKRLRALRKKKGFHRQLDFSEKCGIENAHMSRLENGKKEPKLTTLRTLADALGVTISELTKGV